MGLADSDQTCRHQIILAREEGAQVTVNRMGEQIKSVCKSFPHINLTLVHLLNLLHAQGTDMEKRNPQQTVLVTYFIPKKYESEGGKVCANEYASKEQIYKIAKASFVLCP